MLRGFQRTYPKLDVEAAMQTVAEETSYLSEPVIEVTVVTPSERRTPPGCHDSC
jgi:hypothetical protein